MKKTYSILLLLVFSMSFSQAITINSTSYTAEQLVNDVLINSPCVFGTNISMKTGSMFGSTNSIGYFENTNANFPFTRGVVLTTGDVTKTPSPNSYILSDGNTSWTGDTDLESNLLSQSGITMKSINASYIEFDFQPKTSNFDFSFLFASEEYGTSQCNFSDAFAFLLKDVTANGPNLNIGVIPNTSIPVTVETIRNGFYNDKCPSANPGYFESFNGSGFGPAINFNGQTIEMIASAANLDTSHTYRIKIVIADGGNNTEYDSAIFLKADSFNLGQNVLGPDYSIKNKSALCPGDVLPTLSAHGLKAGTTYVWKKNGVAFSPAQTGTTLDLNKFIPAIGPGTYTYSVTYKEPTCAEVTDEIKIQIYPQIGSIAAIPNIYICDSGATSNKFDFTKTISTIIAGANVASTSDDLPSGTVITFHNTKEDALAGINPIGLSYTMTSPEIQKTIYTRVKSPTTPCTEIRVFQIQIVDKPTIATLPELKFCARNTTDVVPLAYFNFTEQKDNVLGTQNPLFYTVSFHSSLDGANNNTNLIALTSNNIILTSDQTVWTRLQNNSNHECYAVSSFNIKVVQAPNVDFINDAFVCDSYTLPNLIQPGAQYWTGSVGTGTQLYPGDKITTTSSIYVFNRTGDCTKQILFKVTIVKLSTITPPSTSNCTQYKLPALPYGKYYTNSGGQNTPGNQELAAGTVLTTSGPNTIYIWFKDATVTPNCFQESSFTITIIPFQELPDYESRFSCDSYTLPVDPNGGTYYSGPNKGLPIIPAGTNITTSKKIYVYKQTTNLSTNCKSEKSFMVYVSPNDIVIPKDHYSCSAYTLPVLTFGEYRTAPENEGEVVPAGTLITATTNLWFYVKDQICIDNTEFIISINLDPLPIMEDTAPQCDVYILPQVEHTGNYYTESLGNGILLPVGYQVTATQKIYFYDKVTIGGCYLETSFTVNIQPSPLVDAKPVEVVKCGENFIVDDLVNGEYYEFEGGPSPTNPILQPGLVIKESKTIYVYAKETSPISCVSEYSIKIIITNVNDVADVYACNNYELPNIIGLGDYYTAPNGPHGTGQKLSKPYEPITTTTRLYVYVEDTFRISCYKEISFLVTITKIPIIDPIAAVKRCESYALPAYESPITNYYASSGGPTNSNVEKFPGDIITASTTIYAYAKVGTEATVICSDEKPMNITIKSKPNPHLNIPSICIDQKTMAIANAVVESGFSAPRYSCEWKKEDGTIVGTNSSFSTKEPGNYNLTVTDLSIYGCVSDIIPFTLKKSSTPKSVSITTSNWFSDNQTIVVNAVPFVGDGSDFLYSLDGSTPQVENTFKQVSSGPHEITIYNSFGCGPTPVPIEIKLINSAKFFTPNGDGFNDNWGMPELQNKADTNIFIFDRYGKLLKQINSPDDSWDGTFNGHSLPADDYWFTITFNENGTIRMFRSHFSLVR